MRALRTRRDPPRCASISAALLGGPAQALAQQAAPAPQSPPAAQQPAPTQEAPPARIKVAVDVVAVDVQIIDRTGQPVPNLAPEVHRHRQRQAPAGALGRADRQREWRRARDAGARQRRGSRAEPRDRHCDRLHQLRCDRFEGGHSQRRRVRAPPQRRRLRRPVRLSERRAGQPDHGSRRGAACPRHGRRSARRSRPQPLPPAADGSDRHHARPRHGDRPYAG